MPISILQVITDTDRRGAQIFAIDLHDALVRHGRAVRTVALAPGAIGGLETPILGRKRLGLRTLEQLRREIRAADVVIAHGSTTLPACAIAGLGTGTPFVYRQISDSIFWAPGGLRRLRVRLGLSRAARVVALWSGAAETLQSHFGVRASCIRVIPNGVPPERFLAITRGTGGAHRRSFGLDESLPTVAFVGALVREKCADMVVESVALLSGVQLLIAGDGPERERLEALASAKAEGRVAFAGSLADPVPVLMAADAVVLPTRSDSMPAVLIEAGLAGLPTIATPVQGIPEIVVDDVTGILVPVGSAPALTDAIRRVTGDPRLASRLGDEARRYCLSRFAIDNVATQYERVLDEVARSRFGSARSC